MTLVAATLASELVKLFDVENPAFAGWAATTADACTNWGNAYDIYAVQATDVSGDILTTANKAAFIATLQANLPTYATGTAALAANAFDLAFIAYWTGAVFAIGTPPTPAAVCPSIGGTTLWASEVSSVVSVVTASTLAGLLLPAFSDITVMSTQDKADSLADAFHTATTTAVIVLITGLDTTPPPAGPLPITNTCTIF